MTNLILFKNTISFGANSVLISDKANGCGTGATTVSMYGISNTVIKPTTYVANETTGGMESASYYLGNITQFI